MRKFLLLNLFFALLFFPGQAQNKPSESPVVARGAKLIRLSDKYSFTEGPAVSRSGDVYFTDQPNNQIIKWSASDGSLCVYMDNAGRSNGMYFDQKGNLITCADLQNQLWLIDKDKKVTVLADRYLGKLLNGPNDLWIDQKGGIYFTDPFYQREYWKRGPMEQDGQCVYYLSPDKSAMTRVAGDLLKPNGIIGTPDNRYLYVSDIEANKTYRYDILPNGNLSDRVLFVEKGSDGMTIDNLGNIYITNEAGVTVFDIKGVQIWQIPVDEKWTANVCFGGTKRDKLFITASKSVYIIDMKVSGVR
jgi:gluconolactonase